MQIQQGVPSLEKVKTQFLLSKPQAFNRIEETPIILFIQQMNYFMKFAPLSLSFPPSKYKYIEK